MCDTLGYGDLWRFQLGHVDHILFGHHDFASVFGDIEQVGSSEDF